MRIIIAWGSVTCQAAENEGVRPFLSLAFTSAAETVGCWDLTGLRFELATTHSSSPLGVMAAASLGTSDAGEESALDTGGTTCAAAVLAIGVAVAVAVAVVDGGGGGGGGDVVVFVET